VFEASRILAGQVVFEGLQGLSSDSLANLTASQVLKLVDGVATLGRQDMETRYRKAQLGELLKKFEQESQVKIKKSNGKLTPADLAEIRKAVFGDVA